MNNPTIIIDLAPHLQDFLRHEFRQSGEAHREQSGCKDNLCATWPCGYQHNDECICSPLGRDEEGCHERRAT